MAMSSNRGMKPPLPRLECHEFRPSYRRLIAGHTLFGYRLLRAIYPMFRLLSPNQVIQADDLARAMVDVVFRRTGEPRGLIFEIHDILAMIGSLHWD
jgi:hypothetical protein